MARHNLLPGEVVSAIRNNNVEQPVGSMVAGPVSYSVRARSMFVNVDEIAQTIIRVDNGIPIRVRDVATVRDDFEDITNKIGRAHVYSSHVAISYAVFCLKK